MGWYEDWVQYQKNVATAQAVASGNAALAAQINPQAAKYIGESSSYIARGGAPEQKSALGGILKTVATIAVPVVAAIAAPFLAPVIGTGLAAVGLAGLGSTLGLGALGGAAATSFGAGLTGAALGAGLGAGVGAATGRGALSGAITGGLGGGIGGYMGLGSALGLGPTATAGTVGATGGIPVGVVGGAGGMAVPTFGAASLGSLGAGTLGTAGALGTLGTTGAIAAGAGSPMLSNIIGNLANKFIEGINPGGLADLAMTMYNKPMDGLTEEEKAAVNETAQLARTNQDLFKQRVEQANAVWNAAQANPEKAYAEAVSGVQRGLRETQRQYGTGKYGGTGSERRQAGLARAGAIEAERAGSAAATAETERSDRELAAAAGLTPTSAPQGPAASTLTLLQADDVRKQKYQEQLAKSVGGLFGGVYNRGATPKFSLSYGQ
jgi:hypothetical protein